MAVVDFSWVDPASPDHGKGYWLKAQVVAWADDSFPGFVRIEFPDLDGKPVRFTEKVPVISDDPMRYEPHTEYPVDLLLPLYLRPDESLDAGEPVSVEVDRLDDPTMVSVEQVVQT